SGRLQGSDLYRGDVTLRGWLLKPDCAYDDRMFILLCPNCDSPVVRGPYAMPAELDVRSWVDRCPREGCGWENSGMDLI
ncbi:hypothetical protein, partial [Pseudomonas sp. AB12(2023)]|uniref:hypothetical protein n=1 Tax=Pseudomonas sp. AB12(2023) TaxID=3048597 RepID=UPI002B234AB0